MPFESEEEKLQKVPNAPKNPITDNEKCLFYQWHYLVKKDMNACLKLWLLFTALCKRAVRKESKRRGIYLDEEELQYKADIACEYSLRRYEKYRREQGEVYFIQNFIAEAYNATTHAFSESECDIALDRASNIETISEKEIKEDL